MDLAVVIFPDRGGSNEDDFEAAREQLVDRLQRRENLDDRVADALRTVPRHEFVPESRRNSAYQDRPLPIGSDQTISAPHMVAIMANLLDVDHGDRVLEIGTGCGYHAAVTAELVGAEQVYSVEYEPTLAREARSTLDALGYGAISIRVGDGREGWRDQAPYEAVYLTCAAPSFPDPLVKQTANDGQLLGPIGTHRQELVLARKTDGDIERERHGGVRFVPMRGGARD